MAMGKKRKYSGFSLAEVLMAVGILAIGMIFIGGTFIVGIHLTTVSTERTTASIAAGEAFAKVQLYGVHLADPNLADDHLWPFEDLEPKPIDPNEFAYPSTRTLANKQYFWSALCRRLAPAPDRFVQVTVFVSRKIGAATEYPGLLGPMSRPGAMPVPVSAGSALNELKIEDGLKVTWINDGYTVVENSTGQIYRVLKRDPDSPDTIVLDKPWQGGDSVWVVPPPIGRGRGPCIAVYQKIVSF